jgi:alkanesulfonate monooxygenase SsuD/methylene tetrahydromethanopterin reductase-like flavin-dependent oxidoreductase (luciferase family)
MWESEYFEYHSDAFDFPRRMVTPKPVQDPHPPAWMAATSQGSSAVAGKMGLGLLSFAIMQPLERMAEHIRDYRAAQEDVTPLTRVVNNRVAAYTLVHCADTMEQAEKNGIWDSCWWWYKNLAEFTLQWEFPHLSQEEKDKIFPLLRKHSQGDFDVQVFNKADMIVVGDPDQCMEKVRRYESLGVDQLICYVQFGTLPHESVMRTIQLMGEHVIPELEKRSTKQSISVPAATPS